MSGPVKTLTLGILGGFVTFGFYLLSAGSLVLNGTSSLPHNGYLMLRWPIVPLKGSYIAFHAPEAVDARFQDFPFIKRVVGIPGDVITSKSEAVCVASDCRALLPSLSARGLQPLSEGRVAENHYVVFGDAVDSLDSRYALIGTVARQDILAVGFPVPIPHWTELRTWFH